MTTLIATLLLQGLVVLAVSRNIDGVRVNGYARAVGVAAVYGLLSAVLVGPLKVITFPLVAATFGLFVLVINGFVLWLTDKLMNGFEIRGGAALAKATVVLSIGNAIVYALVETFL